MVAAHMGKRALVLCLLSACGNDQTTTITCGTGTSGSLASGAVTVSGGADLTGASVAAGPNTTVPSGDVTIDCADDIVPTGFIALGPAVKIGPEGTWSDRPFQITLPYKAARLPSGATRKHVRIVAQRANQQPYFPAVANRFFDDTDTFASRVTVEAGELTTYQVVAAADAGTPVTEQFGWNAMLGVSMGGNASMSLAMRHPDRFDSFADLGGEPGPSTIYTLNMVEDFLFGGFCDAASGKLGQMCPKASTKQDQFEIISDYEHMVNQTGDGVGLTLDRSLYMKGVRDMSRCFSNPALYNKDDPNAYAPPGVDSSYFATDTATRCANPIVLHDFFDKKFNPDGSKPVITFCDGGHAPNMDAVFDPTQPQTDPNEIELAVDLNGNGIRDSGEPILGQAYEPFSDVGTDGLADKDEPGYDPVTNPDPNHDDYHYLRNPLGTEGNGTYDEGEPFDDFGLDGIAGTCQQGDTPPTGVSRCYDTGEGNGKWDISPNVQRWYDNDFNRRLDILDDTHRTHMSMWFDGGIRDFLNSDVASNQAVGQAMAKYNLPFGVWNNFAPLVQDTDDNVYDFTTINWDDIPRDNFVRYGDPDASDSQIMAGDGRHVGTANQIIYRVQTAFAFIDKRWPNGDVDDEFDGGQILMDQSFTSPTTGRVSPFALFLPPGYDKPENATKTYPVIYVLHGYGQQPNDLVALSAVVATHMIATEPIESRIQKFIIVYADGRCQPEHDGVPVPGTGDGCERGTFYMDSPHGGTARMEQNLLDLMTFIDTTYRTKQSSAETFVP